MQGLRVTVVGAGIGGLTAALALARHGHEVVVLEAATELRPVGAGISVWPNGVKVLDLLGLGPALAAMGGAMERMAYADRDGRVLLDFPLSALYDRVGERARPVARRELQELLLDAARTALGPDAVRLGRRVEQVDDDGEGPVRVRAGGEVVESDLVVAADGTHSALRQWVDARALGRDYVGYVNWNGLVAEAPDIAPIGTWLTWVGDGRRASVMPVGGGRCYWFFDLPMPLSEVEHLGPHVDELSAAFAGWAPGVARLLDELDPEGVARVPIHDLAPLERWRRGRVVLLGDAAHTMAPDLGQGGCQAMEDAWVLAHHLTVASGSVTDGLDRYVAERRPHTADMIRRARRRADLTHGVDPEATQAWYASLVTDGPDAIVDGLAQSVETGRFR